MKNNNRGKLILFPVGLGNKNLSTCLPDYNKELLNSCQTFIVENLREARRFLVSFGYKHSIDETVFHLLNEHTKEHEIGSYLDEIETGKNIGLLSDAGIPCVADPGAAIVRIAQIKKIEVVPLVGPSSLLMALMGSGFNGQNFAFRGYLPIDDRERHRKLKELEALVYKENQTQIFIEAPYRNNQMLKSILETCAENTKICIAKNILLEDQYIVTKTVREWKKNLPELHKQNTVFLIYK